jgi:hypothetical protein
MKKLSPQRDLTVAEILGMVAIMRAAEARRGGFTPLPKEPKPHRTGRQPQLVRIA